MSSNRLMYDQCAYSKRLEESSGPFNYTMYPGKYSSTSQCRIELGIVGGNNVSKFSGNLVDLESDLRGQTRVASKCPIQKYTPGCDNARTDGDGTPCGLVDASTLKNLPSCQMWSYPAVEFPSLPSPSCTYTADGRVQPC